MLIVASFFIKFCTSPCYLNVPQKWLLVVGLHIVIFSFTHLFFFSAVDFSDSRMLFNRTIAVSPVSKLILLLPNDTEVLNVTSDGSSDSVAFNTSEPCPSVCYEIYTPANGTVEFSVTLRDTIFMLTISIDNRCECIIYDSIFSYINAIWGVYETTVVASFPGSPIFCNTHEKRSRSLRTRLLSYYSSISVFQFSLNT